jgi:hypothetical protein
MFVSAIETSSFIISSDEQSNAPISRGYHGDVTVLTWHVIIL